MKSAFCEKLPEPTQGSENVNSCKERMDGLNSLHSKTLSGNINAHLFPTNKFKTVLVAVFIQQALEKDLAARTALLPAVLERGTTRHPTFMDLKRELEMLYGTSLGSDVLKKGERQVISFSLETVNERYAPEEQLFKKALSILRSVMTDPVLDDGSFKAEYVEQEKDQLSKEIQNLMNDKVSYALERCIQEMCKEERYGVYKYGDIESLGYTEPLQLYSYYRNMLKKYPVDIFVVGDMAPEDVFGLLEETLVFPRPVESVSLPPIEKGILPEEPRHRLEELPVNQGKLTLGYRVNTVYRDADYPAMLFYNGILGGFPHSKLFQNVREKASLAYYAFSRLDKLKGIQLIGSGIEVENYQKALDIIQEQVELIKQGKITHDEMENTRRGLINQLKVVADSPFNLVNYFLDTLIGQRPESVEELIGTIERVQVSDVVDAAQKVRLDTIYFLRSLNGEGGLNRS